jgi:hypothetical protein
METVPQKLKVTRDPKKISLVKAVILMLILFIIGIGLGYNIASFQGEEMQIVPETITVYQTDMEQQSSTHDSLEGEWKTILAINGAYKDDFYETEIFHVPSDNWRIVYTYLPRDDATHRYLTIGLYRGAVDRLNIIEEIRLENQSNSGTYYMNVGKGDFSLLVVSGTLHNIQSWTIEVQIQQ